MAITHTNKNSQLLKAFKKYFKGILRQKPLQTTAPNNCVTYLWRNIIDISDPFITASS